MATTDVQQDSFDHDFDSVNFTDVSELIEKIAGVKPTFEAEYDLTRIDPSERVQVRLDPNNAPKEMVQRFQAQMAFSVFPPIVVTDDDRIVDGNTRYKARWAREERFTPALVVPLEYGDETKVTLEYLGLALNNSNGKALDKAERRQMVRDALAMGMTSRQVSGTTGFEDRIIRAIRLELDAEAKLERVGLKEPDQPATVREASLRALGKAVDLNDEPFKQVAQLVDEAGFNASEVSALAASVRDTGSDELGLETITRERDANAQRIADRKHGGNGHPPASRQLRQRLGYINGREAAVFVETNRERMQEHLDAIEQAIATLTEVAEAQRKVMEDVTA